VSGRRARRRAALAAAARRGARGLWPLAAALAIPAKAAVAQVLLARAWDRTLAGDAHAKPWPWADTWPVARLRLPHQKADLIVLEGASGQALAFGPGHVAGTAAPGTPGLSVVGGHRDTHLSVLKNVRPGDPVEIERPDGEWARYRVTETAVADARLPWHPPEDADGIALVTCYPFDAVVPGGPLRFLVMAEPVY
ncbi:MAG: class GN sortase, partial [Alphaproteobacteria bacterium]